MFGSMPMASKKSVLSYSRVWVWMVLVFGIMTHMDIFGCNRYKVFLGG